MPREPRSWTANSSSARTTSTSPDPSHAATGVDPAGDGRFVVPAHTLPAAHPPLADDADRAGGVALHHCRRPTPRRSRRGLAPSRTGGRRPSTRRSLRPVARPSSRGHRRTVASRRSPARASGPRLIASCMPSDHPAGSVVGATSTPELVTRRSWTCGRSGSVDLLEHEPADRRRPDRRRDRPPPPAPPASAAAGRGAPTSSEATDVAAGSADANRFLLGTVSTNRGSARVRSPFRRVVMGARGTTPDQVAAALSATRPSTRVARWRELKPATPGIWIELAKDVAALANSGGGVIVFGVGRDGTPTGWNPEHLLQVGHGPPPPRAGRVPGGRPRPPGGARSHGRPEGGDDARRRTRGIAARVRARTAPTSTGTAGSTRHFGAGWCSSATVAAAVRPAPQDLERFAKHEERRIRRDILQHLRQVAKAPPGSEVIVVPPRSAPSGLRRAVPSGRRPRGARARPHRLRRHPSLPAEGAGRRADPACRAAASPPPSRSSACAGSTTPTLATSSSTGRSSDPRSTANPS